MHIPSFKPFTVFLSVCGSPTMHVPLATCMSACTLSACPTAVYRQLQVVDVLRQKEALVEAARVDRQRAETVMVGPPPVGGKNQ